MSLAMMMDGFNLNDLVRAMFANNEQGLVYDPSDFSTLYQDAAGTTPVTALGQGVGLMLDKRLGLVLGSERRQDFVTGLGGSAAAATYNTSTGVGSVTRVDLSNQSFVRITGLTATSGYRMSITNTGVLGMTVRQIDYAGTVVANIAPSQTVSFLFTGHANCVIASNGGTATFVLNSFRELPGNHAYQTTAASRPTIQQDSNGMFYLASDGLDDGMVTNSINFTGTDKMTVWAGVRKLGGATAVQSFVELSGSASNPGVFSIFAPRSTPGIYNFLLNGGAAGSLSTNAAYIEPVTNVLSCAFDISQPLLVDEIRPRINRVVPTLATLDAGPAGTGNFGNYQLYLFRRAGTTMSFNGRCYGLIIRGAASNASQIQAIEQYMNNKTRAY